MDDPTKSFLRSLAAVLFLGVLGAVLARPIFTAGEERRAPERRSPALVVAQPSASPRPTRARRPKPPATFVYAHYPKSCLRPVAPPSGYGLVASFHYGKPGGPNQISIGSSTGGTTTSFPGMAPLQWSPSGRWLVSRGLELHDAGGRAYPVRVRGLEPWAWSPISDCLLVIADDDLVVIQPPDRKTVLVSGDLDWFGFSPDGRALVTSEGAIDLSENPVGPMPSLSPAPASCNIGRRLRQESCAPAGNLVAAILDDRLVLTDIEGSFVQPLTTDTGWIDSSPEWGPRGSGVLFVRKPTAGGAPQVWFVAEGGNPRPTGLVLPNFKGAGVRGWSSYLDWSATPPDGSMPPIPGS